MLRLFFLILLVCFLSFVQAEGLSFWGIIPNLAFSAIIASSFFVNNIWEGLLLVFISTFIFKFAPGFQEEIFIFSLLGGLAVVAAKHLPLHYLINNIVLTVLATLGFYFLTVRNLVFTTLFLKELVFNLVANFLIYIFLYYLLNSFNFFRSSRNPEKNL